MPDIWCIYHVSNCIYAKPSPKNKFVSIVCRSPNYMGFLINTDIHPFIMGKPDLLSCQVKILASQYKFLDHDSYINCVDLYQFKQTDLVNYCVPVNIVTKTEIIKAVKNSKTIELRFQKMILTLY
jgi:hypothetical protein